MECSWRHTGTGKHGKKTPGGALGEPGHTRDTRAHTGTRITQTNLTNHPNPTTHPHSGTVLYGTVLYTVCPVCPVWCACRPPVHSKKAPPGGARKHWIKDAGGSPDTHETDTRTSRTNKNQPQDQPHPPTHTRQTTRQGPRNARALARVITNHTTHPIKLGGGDGGGDGAQTREQRGREPDRNGDGTPQCAGTHRYSTGSTKTPGELVQRHRGEPGHTREPVQYAKESRPEQGEVQRRASLHFWYM